MKLKLQDRIDFAGAVSDEDLAALYRGADVFVQASRFEGYGMAVAQAIAHGVPVVATAVGAIPDMVPPDAGILLLPDDSVALAAALRRMIENDDERRRLTDAVCAAAARLP